MKSFAQRIFLLLCITSWVCFCLAQEPQVAQRDAVTSSPLDTSYSDENQPHEEEDGDQSGLVGGDESVQSALKLLARIQPPKLSLARLSKHTGFVGSIFGYVQDVFSLLFLNAPSHAEFTADAAPSSSPKPSSNLAKAVKFLEGAAASHSNPDALWLLAELNFHGNYSHPRNYSTAFGYYNQLANFNGNASAQHMLGFMYATGIGGGVKQDQAKALLYHTFAADQGHVQSQMTLGYRYHVGIGTPRNCDNAVKYYKQVARQAVDYYKSGPPGGHVLVKNSYRIADEEGGFYGEGASVASAGANAKTGSPASDAYADISDVLEYLDLQSRKGDLRASFQLAKLYYDGARGFETDMKLAKLWFMHVARALWNKEGKVIPDVSSSAEKLAARSAGYLGRIFLRGEGTQQSFEKALIWFKRGIQYGDTMSQYSMGVMYMQGLGVPRDPIKASLYLASAADAHMAVAQTDLGVLFLDQGQTAVARQYFDLAIRHGHIEAYYYLAEIANQGLVRERSCSTAVTYYKIASEMAEVVHSKFIEANEAFENGDTQKALVAYMMAAEQGYESAQANVAWLLDQTRPLYSIPALLSYVLPFIKQQATSASDAALSLIYYTRSARQQNFDSLVKAGDIHLAGVGINPAAAPEPTSSTDESKAQQSPPALLQGNAENAAACYQAAAESLRSAQAMWNLGWMHETGTGVEQDYHLAKRYYDMALETNKEAYLPVKLSLLKLQVRSWWNDVSDGGVRGIGEGEEQTKKQNLGFWDFIARFIEADREMALAEAGLDGEGDDAADLAAHGGAGMDDDNNNDAGREGWAAGQRAAQQQDPDYPGAEYLTQEELDEGLLEGLGIIVLAGVLAALIWWRQQRVQRAQREAAAAAALAGGNDQAQHQQQQQEQRQIWPAPDDPDFAPWNMPAGIGP